MHLRPYATVLLAALCLAATACSFEEAPPAGAGGPGGGGGTTAPPATTAEKTLEPVQARVEPTEWPNPSLVENVPLYDAEGFGELRESAGWPHLSRTLDGTAAPARGANPRRLVRFVHLSDLQLMDDESPNRTGLFDTTDVTESALRPQDPLMCRMVDAAVRTINAVHRADPLSFVLMGGDNSDSAQSNEVAWVLQLLDGADSIECDSGEDDDLVPGPDNDGKDPFPAEGLAVPWRWVTGNHDVCVQGNFPITDKLKADALGTVAAGGTRDWRQGGAIVNEVVADPRRAVLTRPELMAKVGGDADGHGLPASLPVAGKAFYTFDVEGTPLRFLILDTGAETGGASGMLHGADVDAFVRPALDEARAGGKYVVLASHHAADRLTSNGGAFGTEQPDAVLPEQWMELLAGYPNVVFSMVGHTHQHRATVRQTTGGHAYWEVMTAAIADFPHQFRVVEIWDEDNGFLKLQATCMDLAVDGDPLAARGRELGVIDFVSGWRPRDGRGAPDERNVELYVAKPAAP